MATRHDFLLKSAIAYRAKRSLTVGQQALNDLQRTQQKINELNQNRTYLSEKEVKKRYLDTRSLEADLKTALLAYEVSLLENILATTLSTHDHFDVQKFKYSVQIPPYSPPQLGNPPPKPDPKLYAPEKPTGVQSLLPKVKEKYEMEYEKARRRYKADFDAYKNWFLVAEQKTQRAETEYRRKVEEIKRQETAHNGGIDQFQKGLTQGNPQAVVDYFTFVLMASIYPDEFPQHAKLAYLPNDKQLVIEYDLPSYEIVPELSGYKYVKAKDEITTVFRPVTQRKALYLSVIAQITIRTLHEVFEADIYDNIKCVTFNGYAKAIDRGTGREARRCVVSVQTTREVFETFDLTRVEPSACLKVLHAEVSKNPDDLVPIKPILEFNKVDPRFVEETNALSSLDQRPNLMELSPIEFEALIAKLFKAMGLETQLTQASHDGGIDCIAVDSRPVVGGRIIIQAKRYKNTVGVSAVRDLFGTLQSEGASKGILVTTSGFGRPSFEFADGKPIELVEGRHLLYLLENHVGIKAKIIPPNSWKDPNPDIP